jgi:hypothetical protein
MVSSIATVRTTTKILFALMTILLSQTKKTYFFMGFAKTKAALNNEAAEPSWRITAL